MYGKHLCGIWQVTIQLYYHVLFPKNKQQDDVSLGLTMDNVNSGNISLCPRIVALAVIMCIHTLGFSHIEGQREKC